jgi:acetyl esterase/lipase
MGIPAAVLAVPAVTSHAAYLKASDAPWPSCSENEFAPCLNWARILYFRDYSSPDGLKGEVAHIVRQPLDGNLHGVCPTIVLTAACDPIRDEGEAYAQKLIKEGVLTTVRRYSGVPHPFMHMSPIKKAQMYVEDVCAALKAAHGL